MDGARYQPPASGEAARMRRVSDALQVQQSPTAGNPYRRTGSSVGDCVSRRSLNVSRCLQFFLSTAYRTKRMPSVMSKNYNYEQEHQSKRLSLRTFSHMGHQLDLVAAQNSPELQQDLADLNHIVTTWFSQYLLN